jgi:hypothetical protein
LAPEAQPPRSCCHKKIVPARLPANLVPKGSPRGPGLAGSRRQLAPRQPSCAARRTPVGVIIGTNFAELTNYCRRVESNWKGIAERLYEPHGLHSCAAIGNSRGSLRGSGFGREETMSGTDLTTVILMVFAVMILMSFWRQIAILILYLAVTVFCLGVYYVVSTIKYLI